MLSQHQHEKVANMYIIIRHIQGMHWIQVHHKQGCKSKDDHHISPSLTFCSPTNMYSGIKHIQQFEKAIRHAF
jgi:hypothetical protein